MTEEKRQHHRFTVEVAAEIDTAAGMLVAATKNISTGGVAVILDQPLEKGATVGLTLFLTEDGIEDPDEEPFETRAEVVWSTQEHESRWASGVRFGAIRADQEAQLKRYLKALGS